MDLQQRIFEFICQHRLAVIATNSVDGPPESALVGIAASSSLELVFDTTGFTRKAINLRRDPRISAVIGWEDEETVQFEGIADEPVGTELDRARALYFGAYPDGRERLSLSGLTHFLVRPTWIRFTSYLQPALSGELRFGE
jgi:hypothetical protein